MKKDLQKSARAWFDEITFFVLYKLMSKEHQDTVSWVDMQLARKGLMFYQVIFLAIILYDTFTEVVVMEFKKKIKNEKENVSLLPPPEISLKIKLIKEMYSIRVGRRQYAEQIHPIYSQSLQSTMCRETESVDKVELYFPHDPHLSVVISLIKIQKDTKSNESSFCFSPLVPCVITRARVLHISSSD